MAATINIGNPKTFAIQSRITEVSPRPSQMGLGFFVIQIEGHIYGLKEPEATMLGCSFIEVARRLAGRGSHHFPVAMDAAAGDLASAFRRAVYMEYSENDLFLGMTAPQFLDAAGSSRLKWAPDGDEAFDDGSYVLQLEDEKEVRLVAFTVTDDPLYDPASLREVRLTPDEFYGVLQAWLDAFRRQWKSSFSKL